MSSITPKFSPAYEYNQSIVIDTAPETNPSTELKSYLQNKIVGKRALLALDFKTKKHFVGEMTLMTPHVNTFEKVFIPRQYQRIHTDADTLQDLEATINQLQSIAEKILDYSGKNKEIELQIERAQHNQRKHEETTAYLDALQQHLKEIKKKKIQLSTDLEVTQNGILRLVGEYCTYLTQGFSQTMLYSLCKNFYERIQQCSDASSYVPGDGVIFTDCENIKTMIEAFEKSVPTFQELPEEAVDSIHEAIRLIEQKFFNLNQISQDHISKRKSISLKGWDKSIKRQSLKIPLESKQSAVYVSEEKNEAHQSACLFFSELQSVLETAKQQRISFSPALETVQNDIIRLVGEYCTAVAQDLSPLILYTISKNFADRNKICEDSATLIPGQGDIFADCTDVANRVERLEESLNGTENVLELVLSIHETLSIIEKRFFNLDQIANQRSIKRKSSFLKSIDKTKKDKKNKKSNSVEISPENPVKREKNKIRSLDGNKRKSAIFAKISPEKKGVTKPLKEVQALQDEQKIKNKIFVTRVNNEWENSKRLSKAFSVDVLNIMKVDGDGAAEAASKIIEYINEHRPLAELPIQEKIQTNTEILEWVKNHYPSSYGPLCKTTTGGI